MASSRVLTAVVGLAISLLVSVAAWVYFDTFALFLFLPFVPFFFRRTTSQPAATERRECPQCGFWTTDSEVQYCPRDGTRLD